MRIVTAGLEPATRALEKRCSHFHLSYVTQLAAKPGIEPGVSRFKAERVASYTTPQSGGWGRNRTADAKLFKPALYTSELPNQTYQGVNRRPRGV